MSPSPQLAPAGSSTYSSDTLHVGDGTWDSQRETFLLPNLMGLNFETMRYNGMGNRFRNMAEYHSLIRAHGVIAAITFLGIVPAAILLVRFYSRRPSWALRLHMWLQILTLFLSTVIFVLGWFAVGPKRSLTNPHHGIGLAIYVLIIAQTFWGWLVHKIEKGKRRLHRPLKLMLHQWMGRAIALLGIAQIPLGLTLYGSPLSLFILYALAVFGLLLIYFILIYLHERRVAYGHHASHDSYLSGPEVVDDRHGHSNVGRLAAVGAAGAGLAMLGRRFTRRSRSRSRSPVDDYSERTPHSYVDEKSEDSRRGTGWGKRLLQVGAVAGAAGLAKKFFDRRRERESDTESGRYQPARTRRDSLYDEDSELSRVEEARPRPTHPRTYDGPPPRPPSSYSDSGVTYSNAGGGGGEGHGLRDAIAGAGAFAALRGLFKSRRAKEQDRIEEIRRADIEAERIARNNSQRRYTGDGHPRRDTRRRHSPASSFTGPTNSEVADQSHATPAPPPPAHQDIPSPETVATGRRHRYDPIDPADAALGGAAAAEASGHRRRSGGHVSSVDSPPVSLKVRVQDEGRRVTLRRLTEEEVAASRKAKRQGGRRSSRRRHGSVSSLSGGEGNSHWRRVEERERQQQEQMRRDGEASTMGPGASTAPTGSMPAPSGTSVPLPPPPIPPGMSNLNSPISTDLSGSHASKRDRRRAERRKLSGQGRHNVEFT